MPLRKSLKTVRRTRINQVSKKRKTELDKYRKLRVDFLKENPRCAVDAIHEATDVHHKKGRGVLLNEVKYWLPVCRACHVLIEKNPLWAKEKGYSLNRIAKDE